MNHRPVRTSTPARRTAVAVLAALGVLLAGCGDDDKASTTVPATTVPATTVPATTVPATTVPDTIAPELQEFCSVAEEVNASEPTVELVQRYVAVAPDAISAPAAVVLAAFETADGDLQAVFGDPAVLAAVEELTAFEAEACGLGAPADPGMTEIDPNAIRVDVSATEYHLDFQSPTAPGRYSFVMTNDGAEPHLMILLHLEEGATIDQVMASQGEAGVLASFESGVAAPGSDAVVTADLGPGRWVIVCPIPNAAGDSHAALGMVHEFDISG